MTRLKVTVWFVRRSHQALTSDQFVHVICGSYSKDSEGFGLKVSCNYCVRKNRINIEWEGATSGQEQQAQIMVSCSNSKASSSWYWDKSFGKGAWPWSRTSSPRNILAVVVDVSSSGLYLLGLLERLYARNEFTTTDNFIEAHDVPSSSPSLRSASMTKSGSKQGFVSCHCRRYCIDKKCKCLSKCTKCNSKCHYNSSCKNKWALPMFLVMYFLSIHY